jgi:mycoredoxin-dependent peroxiredoxin
MLADCQAEMPARAARAFVRAEFIGYHRCRVALHSQYSVVFVKRTGRNDMAISVGAAAPDFVLKDQSQKEVKLSDFRGKKNVVIVFYPLDWSPVCTNEHACFVNDMKRFEQLDAQVLGISVDSAWSHKAFAEKMGIHYPLLADFQPRGAVGEKFGVYLAEKGITGRAIAIVDRSGKIAWFKNYDIPTVPDLKEVADALAKAN